MKSSEQTRQQLCELFVSVLNRPANWQEAGFINWINGCDDEHRGVLVDILKEIGEKRQ
ncbi:hypothetical protein ACFRCQ_23645 [Cytobacillus firmus]|uniref:hypothetical protein n=1 Tax=Cytobacillus firmus TaxID=1399 RepID=UPI0036816118